MIDTNLPYHCAEIPVLNWGKDYDEPESYRGLDVEDYEADPFTLDLTEIIGVCPCGINKDRTTVVYLRGGHSLRVLVPTYQMREMWFAAKATKEQRNLLTNNS